MKFFYKLVKEFFRVALVVWLILLFLELINPGMVVRFVNLEYYFYALVIIFVITRLEK